MEQLARVIIFLEILVVNLLITHSCSRRKYPLRRIIGELTFFTAAVFAISFLMRILFESPFINSSIIMLLGFTYFLPLKHLYDESSERILSIMFFSWIHTLTISALSIQTSELFGFTYHFGMALIVQTSIFLFSTPIVIKYVKDRFLYILTNIPREMNKYLSVLSLVEFATLSIVFLYFRDGTSIYWRLITVAFVALIAAMNYHLIYIVVKNFMSISFLKQLAYTDTLTGIKNRTALLFDCEKLISENVPFAFIFMDLDNFKMVNDTYGHSVGDEYLKQFTRATRQTLGPKGIIYRLSGDEFICIYREEKIDSFLQAFDEKIKDMFKMNIPFLGVSIGYARFPEDANSLDKLIKKSDVIMYDVKNSQRM